MVQWSSVILTLEEIFLSSQGPLTNTSLLATQLKVCTLFHVIFVEYSLKLS